MSVCGLHFKTCREEYFEHFKENQDWLLILLLNAGEKLSIQVLFILTQETTLFEVLKVAHRKNLFGIRDLFKTADITLAQIRLVQRGLLGFLLEPFENEYKGDFLCKLPCHFIFDLLFCDVPPVVIPALRPLLLCVLEQLREMREIVVAIFKVLGLFFQDLLLFKGVFEQVIEDLSVEHFELGRFPGFFEDITWRDHHRLQHLMIRDGLEDVRVKDAARHIEVDLVIVPSAYRKEVRSNLTYQDSLSNHCTQSLKGLPLDCKGYRV